MDNGHSAISTTKQKQAKDKVFKKSLGQIRQLRNIIWNVSWNLEINKSSKHWKQIKEYSSNVYSMYLNMCKLGHKKTLFSVGLV